MVATRSKNPSLGARLRHPTALQVRGAASVTIGPDPSLEWLLRAKGSAKVDARLMWLCRHAAGPERNPGVLGARVGQHPADSLPGGGARAASWRKESSTHCVRHEAAARVRAVAQGRRCTLARSAGGNPIALSQAVVPVDGRVTPADNLQLVVARNGSEQALALRTATKGLRAIFIRQGAVAGTCAREC